jgi:hypothetical protein
MQIFCVSKPLRLFFSLFRRSCFSRCPVGLRQQLKQFSICRVGAGARLQQPNGIEELFLTQQGLCKSDLSFLARSLQQKRRLEFILGKFDSSN